MKKKMKKNANKFLSFFLCVISVLLLTGCTGNGGADVKFPGFGGSEKKVGQDIQKEDVKEFFHTYENINYGAYYQRHHFYTEDGAYYCAYEYRERENEYGPCTEADVTAEDVVLLTDEQWQQFWDCIKDGTVKKRGSSAESGSSGPWSYLYWSNDKGSIQEYSFASPEKMVAFENFCKSLEN